MQQMTVIRAQNSVAIDGKAHQVNTRDILPAYVRVLQWNSDRGGELEFVNDGQGVVLPPHKFSDIAPYQALIDRWNDAEAEEKKAKQDAKAALAMMRE